MPKYIIAYHGIPQAESPEAGAASRQRFMEWIRGLGEAVVNPGTPLLSPRIVRPGGAVDSGGAEVLSGFSVVTAGSLEEALGMAQSSPYLEQGAVQVAEMMEMGN